MAVSFNQTVFDMLGLVDTLSVRSHWLTNCKLCESSFQRHNVERCNCPVFAFKSPELAAQGLQVDNFVCFECLTSLSRSLPFRAVKEEKKAHYLLTSVR